MAAQAECTTASRVWPLPLGTSAVGSSSSRRSACTLAAAAFAVRSPYRQAAPTHRRTPRLCRRCEARATASAGRRPDARPSSPASGCRPHASRGCASCVLCGRRTRAWSARRRSHRHNGLSCASTSSSEGARVFDLCRSSLPRLHCRRLGCQTRASAHRHFGGAPAASVPRKHRLSEQAWGLLEQARRERAPRCEQRRSAACEHHPAA